MSEIRVPQKQIFSHTHVFSGMGTPYLYYKNGGGVVDGIGRQHINLYGKCDICNKEILVAKIHVDSNGKLYGYEKNHLSTK